MTDQVELFSTSTCPKCELLAAYLSEHDIPFVKRVIDEDPVAETDAARAHISAAPSLKIGKRVLKKKGIFKDDGGIASDVVTDFINQ